MPTPVSRDVHIDVGLTQVSQRVKNEQFIADQILPVITVKKDSDKIWVYGKESLRIEDDTYVPGNDAKEGEWSISAVDAYALQPYRKKGKIIWEYRDKADDPIKYEQDTITIEREKQLLMLENRVATKLTNPATYAGNSGAAAAKWSDFTNSDPVADIDAARNVIFDKTLKEPNTLILPRDVYFIIRRHPKLLDMYKYVQGGKLTLELLKEIFEVDRILVSATGKITSAEGQTITMDKVWDNTKVILAYVAPSAGLQQISFGYLYRKDGYPFVERYVKGEEHADLVYTNDKYDFKIQAPEAGYLLTTVL